MKNRIENNEREKSHLQTLLRTTKADKEIKIAEMAGTIKSLMVRGDMYSQLAACRQELEAERLTVFHLRAEMDSYRNLLEQEQRKCSSLTKEMSTLQGKLDGNELAQTLFNIPGVNPATVLEVMSSEFVQVRTELSKAQSNLLESTEQVKTLQRLLESQTEKLSIATKSSQNMNPSPDTKRSKSQFKRTTWSTDQENFPPLNNTMESDFMASPESSPTSPQLFNVVIEGDTSPRTLLQAYEISTLLNKIASQESMIKKLQQEAEEAHASTLHRMKVGDMELVDKSERLEWENSVKLMELANVRIDELKKEVDLLKDEKADLEKKLCDFNTSTHGKISSTTKWKLEDDLPLLTSNDSIATTVKEIEDLKNELKEKSMKIKILTSSLESLQYAGVGEMQHDFNAQNAMDLLNSSNSRNLEQLAAMSLPNENHSVWAKQALVKRIVDLTSELSAKAVEANREKQRSDELENKYRQSMRELSKAHAILSASESEKSSLQKTEEILTKQVQDFERQLIDCQMSLKKENDQLVTALREAECDANEFILKIDELSLQLKHTERKDILQFMDSVLAAARVVESNDDQVLSQPTWSGENVGNSAPEPGLKQMIQTLLTEWRESVGVIPPKISSFASQTLPKLSKGEQQFYQKVTDMVTKAHQKVVDITATNVTIEHKMKLKQKENENLKYQLEICAQQLTSLKRRNFAYERAVRSNHKHLAAKNGRVVSVLRKALTEERSRYSQVSSDLRTERKQRLLLNIERVVEASDKRRLQSQLAALEAKGSSFLRGKEDATNSMKDKLRELESDFFNWTKIELPRLVSGLPVTEDAIAGLTYGHTNSMPDQTVGSERTYALSQALCASKVTQATLDMKILELSEKLGIERDKNIALEGVLIKWRDQIEKTISGDDHDGQRIDVDYAQRLVFTSMEKEQTMIDSMSRLNLQVTELEEEIVEYRARLEHAESQAKQAKSMLEASYEQDETTKSKAIQQLTKIRIDLENEHAKELKSLREAYEAERRQLMDELRSVAEAVEEAKITAPHVSRWPAIPDEKSFDYNSAPADIPWYQPKRSNVDGQPDNTSEATGSRESAAGFAKIDKAKGGKPSEGLLSKQIRSQKVHNLDERSKEDKEIGISMLDSYSDSGSVAEALNAMANISNSSTSNGSIRDVQIENMVRMVELEKRKSAEARLEVKELEELLAIQQRYIKDTVGNLKRKEGKTSVLICKYLIYQLKVFNLYLEELNSREAELSNQQQKVTQSHADEKAVKHLAEAVEEEVRKEDRSLWPSVGNLAEELIGLLQSITLRFSPSDLENDLLRSALSMACRLKEACATAQFHAKFESFLTGREPAVFEQTDKLSFNPGGVEMSESMQTLANRVKLIESDLAERNVPERYLYLLRDLRIRVSELEQTFTMQLEKERERWAVERATLLKKDSETTAYANQILREKEDSVQTIKMRYEEALKKAEDTLEANTSAAKREIERLEELVKSLSNHLANEQQEKASIAEISRNSSTGKSSAEEFFKMQKLLDHTSDELERSRQEVHHIHNQYSKDIDDLKHNFTKFRQAHDQLVKNLEEQLEESQLRENYSTSLSEDPSMLSGFMLSSSAAPKKSKIEVEERLRKLEYKYKSKCGELDAVLR